MSITREFVVLSEVGSRLADEARQAPVLRSALGRSMALLARAERGDPVFQCGDWPGCDAGTCLGCDLMDLRNDLEHLAVLPLSPPRRRLRKWVNAVLRYFVKV